jgi:putative membrane protein
VVALVAAAWLVPGIRVEGTNAIIAFGIMAIILGLLNAFLRPVLQILAIPAIILTLGLFLLVINAPMLMLSAWIARNFLCGRVLVGLLGVSYREYCVLPALGNPPGLKFTTDSSPDADSCRLTPHCPHEDLICSIRCRTSV